MQCQCNCARIIIYFAYKRGLIKNENGKAKGTNCQKTRKDI